MAIASFVLQMEPGRGAEAAAALSRVPGLTLEFSGEQNLVAVVERASAELPQVESGLKEVPGVLCVITAYLNIEDELEEAGSC